MSLCQNNCGLKVYLAPMEGLTGFSYRNAFDKYFGAGRVEKYFTPFISPNSSMSLMTKELRDIDPANQGDGMKVIPQVLTNKADEFIWTAKKLVTGLGYDEININMGCPSGTVVSKDRGSGILKNPALIDKMLYEIFSDSYIIDSKVKISVKTRLGFADKSEFRDILKVFNKYDLEELIIHPRVRSDFYKNEVDYDSFDYAIRESSNPLVFNGDIFTVKDICYFRERFPNEDKLMLGRGLIADPGLISVLADPFPQKHERDLIEDRRRMKLMLDEVLSSYVEIMHPDKNAIHRMKELWCYMEYSFSDCKREIKDIKKAQNIYAYKDAVKVFFNNAKLQPKEHIRFAGKY